jgi:hypothetical protein
LQQRHLPVVPIQIMDGCLAGIFTDNCVLKEVLPTPLLRPPRPSTLSSWLPALKKYLPHSWMNSQASTKAVKNNDAGIPVHMWDQRILLVLPWVAPVILFLRRHLMFLITRNVYVEFAEFMPKTHGRDWASKLVVLKRAGRKEREQGGQRNNMDNKEQKYREKGHSSSTANQELIRNAEVGVAILHNFGEADWWTWSGGSTLIFWRWPEGPQRVAAREGMTPWISGKLPRCKRRAKPPPTADRKLMWQKFDKFLRRGYVRLKRRVLSLTDYFRVPKGDDIRIVFNGTS